MEIRHKRGPKGKLSLRRVFIEYLFGMLEQLFINSEGLLIRETRKEGIFCCLMVRRNFESFEVKQLI